MSKFKLTFNLCLTTDMTVSIIQYELSKINDAEEQAAANSNF